jgi:hypothetical protein
VEPQEGEEGLVLGPLLLLDTHGEAPVVPEAAAADEADVGLRVPPAEGGTTAAALAMRMMRMRMMMMGEGTTSGGEVPRAPELGSGARLAVVVLPVVLFTRDVDVILLRVGVTVLEPSLGVSLGDGYVTFKAYGGHQCIGGVLTSSPVVLQRWVSGWSVAVGIPLDLTLLLHVSGIPFCQPLPVAHRCLGKRTVVAPLTASLLGF